MKGERQRKAAAGGAGAVAKFEEAPKLAPEQASSKSDVSKRDEAKRDAPKREDEKIEEATTDDAKERDASGDPTSIGPTARIAAPECPTCKKSNHATAERCVFCGAELPEIASSVPLSPPARVKTGWAEGPESERRSDSEPPPQSRRPEPSFEEIPAGTIADPLIGVVVAERYRILEPLGRGGMGAVYKVEHTRIGKLLAMKLLTGELSRNPDVVRRFKQEALTASKLSNANTVQVFDFGVAEGLTYLVMELVAGEDLGRVLRTGGPMGHARLAKIIVQVCSSLAEAHAKGIVHRDIKPENIMLVRARDGTDIAKVLDFGLAKLRESSELNEVTSQGAIVGTPYFMAPEQIRGESVDNRTDIYALGAMMYRALTGAYPFSGPTPMAVFTKHLTELPVAPVERAPELGIPHGLSTIVMKMLAKSPAERFAKVEDLQAALVDEMKASGTSSLESLLDSRQIRKLQSVANEAQAVPSIVGAAPVTVAIATRDEVEAYERKLRRQRWGALVVAGAIALGLAGVLAKLAVVHTSEAFTGLEREPNNAAKEANELPIGKSVSGFLGKRMDADHADRDFYAFTVAPGDDARRVVSVHVTAIPNMAMCTMIYKQGLQTPLGQYCVGRPGRDLVIPQLALEPGNYLASVTQDIDPYGAPQPPFVYENVSDPYTLTIDDARADPGKEIEPNDMIASANPIAPGASVVGAIAWARDEDIFCAAAPGKAIRWRVKDGVREAGGVLEVTPMRDAEEGVPVRVHVSGKGAPSPNDATSPWVSPVLKPDQVARCIRVRLVTDPWSGAKGTMVPNGGSEPYVVDLEAL